MAIEFECNLEKEYEYNGVDIWGAAFLWNGKKSVEYNFCIDENGEDCSAIYKMTEDVSGHMHTHYDSFVHYEVKFDDGWQEKLKAAMEDALWKLFSDDTQDAETLRERLSDLSSMEDDYEFMLAEYSAAQTYCEEHNFDLSNDDLEELEARRLMECFECWKEQNREY